MTAEQLLIPRFEVINNYPFSEYSIGQLITLDHFKKSENQWFINNGKASLYDAHFRAYPHLFRELNWWELRKEEEMPKKLKSYSFPNDEPYIIEKWEMETLFGYMDLKNRSGCSLTSWNKEFGYYPVD